MQLLNANRGPILLTKMIKNNSDHKAPSKIKVPSKTSRDQGSIFMTPFEYTKIIHLRSLQLSNGEKPLIDWKKLGVTDPIIIARKELDEGKLTFFTVIRRYPDGSVFKYRATDLIVRK
jgi:DNA-directed RNA polymerase subunit K/omega